MKISKVVAPPQEKNTDKHWQMLGRFTYHNYKVLLEATFDEVDYRVRIWDGSFRAGDKRVTPEILTSRDLRIAQSQYEEAVIRLVSKTSFTDVSLFMQRAATKFL